INFRRSARPDPLADERESMVMRALSLLAAAGFEIPGGTLEVHLPRYSAPMTVRRAPSGTVAGRSDAIQIEVEPRDPGDARFVAPTHGLLPPHAGVVYPVGSRARVEESAQGIYSEVTESSFVAIVHEVAHFFHYRSSPERYAAPVQTALLSS